MYINIFVSIKNYLTSLYNKCRYVNTLFVPFCKVILSRINVVSRHRENFQNISKDVGIFRTPSANEKKNIFIQYCFKESVFLSGLKVKKILMISIRCLQYFNYF